MNKFNRIPEPEVFFKQLQVGTKVVLVGPVKSRFEVINFQFECNIKEDKEDNITVFNFTNDERRRILTMAKNLPRYFCYLDEYNNIIEEIDEKNKYYSNRVCLSLNEWKKTSDIINAVILDNYFARVIEINDGFFTDDTIIFHTTDELLHFLQNEIKFIKELYTDTKVTYKCDNSNNKHLILTLTANKGCKGKETSLYERIEIQTNPDSKGKIIKSLKLINNAF